MAAPLLLSLLLLICSFKTGSSAEMFVQTGASVQLDIHTHELLKNDVYYWEKDTSKNIVTYISAVEEVVIDNIYQNKVDFNNNTFSLTLKNVKKTDSGLYTARRKKKEGYIVEYKVSVIDAVEAPVLIRNSNSSESCTANFTCRAHNLTLALSYNSGNCSTKEATSEEKHTLIMYCSKESIICNFSNPVSWKKDSEEIKQFCVNNKENNPAHIHAKSYAFIAWILVLVCILVALLVCLSIYLHRKRKTGAQEGGSTVYAQVEAEAQTQKETKDNQPSTIYYTVGQDQKPAATPETELTIYAVVNKPPSLKPHAISSDDP